MKTKTTSTTLTVLLALILGTFGAMPAYADKASELASKSSSALKSLYANNSTAKAIGEKADSVLVFPEIVKGGFVVAAATGNGALIRDGKAVAYYNSTAASYGLQAGVQTFGYALFIMDRKAMNDLNNSGGWEVGSAPSLVVVDEGISKSISTTTLDKGFYAFFFNQKGLMAGLGLQGSKITRIHPE